jgi:two-component system LytT family response regulator
MAAGEGPNPSETATAAGAWTSVSRLCLKKFTHDGKEYLERLVIKTGCRIYFIETAEIDWIEAEGNYVSVHSAKKSHLLRETISSLESQLDPKKFVRIHRSSIVRLDFIRELQPWFHGEYRVILQDSTQLTLSATIATSCRKHWQTPQQNSPDAVITASSLLVTCLCRSVTKADCPANLKGISCTVNIRCKRSLDYR